jgi:hypothetical protein
LFQSFETFNRFAWFKWFMKTQEHNVENAAFIECLFYEQAMSRASRINGWFKPLNRCAPFKAS